MGSVEVERGVECGRIERQLYYLSVLPSKTWRGGDEGKRELEKKNVLLWKEYGCNRIFTFPPYTIQHDIPEQIKLYTIEKNRFLYKSEYD